MKLLIALLISLVYIQCSAEELGNRGESAPTNDLIKGHDFRKDIQDFPSRLKGDEYVSFIRYQMITDEVDGHQFVTMKPTINLVDTQTYHIIYRKRSAATEMKSFVSDLYISDRIVKSKDTSTNPLQRVHWKQGTSSILEELGSAKDLDYTLSLIKQEMLNFPKDTPVISRNLFKSRNYQVSQLALQVRALAALNEHEVFRFLITSTDALSLKHIHSTTKTSELIKLLEMLLRRLPTTTDSFRFLTSKLQSQSILDMMMYLIQSNQAEIFQVVFEDKLVIQNLEQQDFDEFVNWFTKQDHPPLARLRQITLLPLRKFLADGRAFRVVSRLMDSEWHRYDFMFTPELMPAYSQNEKKLLVHGWIEHASNGNMDSLDILQMKEIKPFIYKYL